MTDTDTAPEPDTPSFKSLRLVSILSKTCHTGGISFGRYQRHESVWIPTAHMPQKEKRIILEKKLLDVFSFQLLFLGVMDDEPLILRSITNFESGLLWNGTIEKIPMGNPLSHCCLVHPEILIRACLRKQKHSIYV